MIGNIYCLLAPRGTPRPVIDALNGLVRRALEDAKLRAQLVDQGAIPEPTTPEGLAEVIAADNAYMGKIVRDLNIPPVD